MNSLRNSLPAKIIAVVLLTVFVLGTIACGSVAVTGYSNAFYYQSAEDGMGDAYPLRQWVVQYRAPAVYAGIALLLLSVLTLVFLLSAAGRRKGADGITEGIQEKIPLDLYFAGDILCYAVLVSIGFGNAYWATLPLQLLLVGLSITLLTLLATALLMTLSVRIKRGRWWKNTVIYRILRWTWRLLGRVCGNVPALLRNLPMLWKTVLIFFGVLIFNVYLLSSYLLEHYYSYGGGFFLFLFILFTLALLAAVCWVSFQLQLLKHGAERLAAGALHDKIDTRRMYWDFKQHGETLNRIGEGMTAAVEERMKSERLKTELITNVSHDLKTPLTSIINYVDLLKKQDLQNAAANEYLAVLDRQAQRLKKLTTDLVEASKASSGSINVVLAATDLAELLNQTMAEYADRLESAGLEPVLRLPEGLSPICADGRLLWRVFDNLLHNICKYALNGTRVYIEAQETADGLYVSMKNISRDPLNLTADELTERFVRGDSARSSEGSGLGLSIARSLTELMGGELRLTVDGDLFKATVRLRKA